MEVISDLKQIQRTVQNLRSSHHKLGVVPTMGALHDGHLSLVRAAREQCDRVIATLFVNPTQFAPNEDLDKYPRPFEKDLELLSGESVDLVFCPDVASMYPDGYSTFVEPPAISESFEGNSRSTHFRGVATIVLKLFHLIPADLAFFGQKDFQQTLVIKKMVADFNMPIKIVVCPIVREPDGLALSSRNSYLSPEDRIRAISLSQTLKEIQSQLESGRSREQALAIGRALIEPQIDELEYLEIVDAESLKEPVEQTSELVVLVAGRVGKTRLIDNLLLASE